MPTTSNHQFVRVVVLLISVALHVNSCVDKAQTMVKFEYHSGVLSAYTHSEAFGDIDRIIFIGIPKSTNLAVDYHVSPSALLGSLARCNGNLIGDVTRKDAFEIREGAWVYSIPMDPSLVQNCDVYSVGYSKEHYEDIRKLEQ